jgi:hypothetical protein
MVQNTATQGTDVQHKRETALADTIVKGLTTAEGHVVKSLFSIGKSINGRDKSVNLENVATIVNAARPDATPVKKSQLNNYGNAYRVASIGGKPTVELFGMALRNLNASATTVRSGDRSIPAIEKSVADGGDLESILEADYASRREELAHAPAGTPRPRSTPASDDVAVRTFSEAVGTLLSRDSEGVPTRALSDSDADDVAALVDELKSYVRMLRSAARA